MRSERNYYLNLCIRQPFSSMMTLHRDGGNKKSPHQLIYLRLEKEKKEGPLQEPVFASDRPTSLFEWHVRINFPRFARRQKRVQWRLNPFLGNHLRHSKKLRDVLLRASSDHSNPSGCFITLSVSVSHAFLAFARSLITLRSFAAC